jgi:enoyl-[acyl-carrier-protein] reductase (NADH)
MDAALSDRRILITGIANEQSLALAIAERLRAEGAELVCAAWVAPATTQISRLQPLRF